MFSNIISKNNMIWFNKIIYIYVCKYFTIKLNTFKMYLCIENNLSYGGKFLNPYD